MTTELLADVRRLDVAFDAGRGGEPLRTLEDVTFRVAPGEFVALVGPSGSGKSTLVRAIAGLLPGSVLVSAHGDVDGAGGAPVRVAQRADPRRGAGRGDRGGRGRRASVVPDVAWMGQTDALLPWKRALENAMVGARMAGTSDEEARRRATELMERFGLGGFERAWPHELSGGMRQRLALVRTVLADRRLLLLDEPFSGLDALTRREMNLWLRETDLVALGSAGGGGVDVDTRSGTGAVGGRLDGRAAAGDRAATDDRPAAGVVLVTHDVEEALTLADRVVVLSTRPGRVVADLPTRGPDGAPAVTADRLLELLGVTGG